MEAADRVFFGKVRLNVLYTRMEAAVLRGKKAYRLCDILFFFTEQKPFVLISSFQKAGLIR